MSDPPPTTAHPRLPALDTLRGLAIVLMVLDHARDYFAPTALPPEVLGHSTPALFLTRWVTHFCAPVFVFLAGTSIYLRHFAPQPTPSAPRGRSDTPRYLITRGLWLILLELTVIGACWGFLFVGVVTLQVIWALGVSMLIMAALVRLPWLCSLVFGAALVTLHNLLDPITAASLAANTGQPWLAPFWMALHEQGYVSFNPHAAQPFTPPGVFFVYPLIPWPGVMALGYAFGRIVTLEPRARARACLLIGAVATAAFVALRAAQWYGEPIPRAQQPQDWPLLAFLNTSKYPPSLQFLLMTLGPAILALPLLDRLSRPGGLFSTPAALLRTFGRVPLFFYLLHIPLIHIASAILWYALYGVISGWQVNQASWPPGYQPRLWVAYVAWALALAALYLPCRWFAHLKATSRRRWLTYL